MNELKGFEPVAWVPKFSWQRSIDATACKSKRSFDDTPLYPAAQLAAVVRQRDELLKALKHVMAYPEIRNYIGSELSGIADAAIAKVQP